MSGFGELGGKPRRHRIDDPELSDQRHPHADLIARENLLTLDGLAGLADMAG